MIHMGLWFWQAKKIKETLKKMCNDFIHLSQITAMSVCDIGRDNTVWSSTNTCDNTRYTRVSTRTENK